MLNNILGNVLDTLLIKDGRIFLRHFHEERTFEAMQFLQLAVNRPMVDDIYSEIERQHCRQENKILRIVFSGSLPLTYTVEMKTREALPLPVKLSVGTIKNEGNSTRFKWEDRARWTELLQLKNPGADDILAVNEDDELVETSRFNIFAYDKERDVVLTPPLSSGCINGVYRRFAFSEAAIELPELGRKVPFEEKILLTEIKNYRLFVANSVRAVLPAEFIPG